MDRKALPSDLTSYDFVKFAALALMVVDHVGAFFLVEEEWLRVIGRLSAPIWLFLVGYAKSRDFSDRMWIGIALLIGSNYLTTASFIPISILGTMLVCRVALDPLMNHIRKNPAALYPITVILCFLTLVTSQVFEYGACAMLAVILGYMTRNRETLPFTRNQFLTYAIVSAFGYYLIQAYYFFPGQFDFAQQVFAGVGLLAVFLGLTCFQPRQYPELTRKLTRPVAWVIQIGGRYSLEFYVGHLILFRAIVYFGVFTPSAAS